MNRATLLKSKKRGRRLAERAALADAAAEAAAGDASVSLTIEELALRSGVTTRNIRAYQTKGLLPPPEVRAGGRTGYYGNAHVARLKLVANLQNLGHSLAGVASLLEAWEQGHTLDQMLGLGETVESTRPAQRQYLDSRALERLLPSGMTTRRALTAMLKAGILIRRERGYELRQPAALRFAGDIIAAGIPVETLLDELPRITAVLNVVAERFVSLYREYVAEPYFEAGLPMAQLPAMQAQLKRLHDSAKEFIDSMVQEALDREIEALGKRLITERTVG